MSNKLKRSPHKTPSKQGLYAKAAAHAEDAIQVLVKLMHNADNDSVRMGAAKTLLNKSIPDLKAMEVSGDNVKPLIIKLDGAPGISTQTTRSVGSAEE